MSKADSDRTVGIVGAGIAGLVLALGLQRRGASPMLLEARSEPSLTSEGAFLTLAPNAMHGLAAIGLSSGVARSGMETTGIEILDERGARLGMIDQSDHAAALGAPSVTVGRGDLMRLLLRACDAAGIPVLFNTRVERIEPEEHEARLWAAGRERRYAWIAACDGLRSSTRAAVFPACPAPRYTGLIGTGGIARIDEIAPTSGVMRMVFGHTGFFGYQKQGDGPVHWFNSFPAERPEQDLGAMIGVDRLRDLHRDDPAVVDQILSHVPELLRTYPIYDLPSLSAWSRGRVVLVGDAAHAIGPHAGQGAAMAIEDAVTLAVCASGAAGIEAAFHRYEALRRPRVGEVARLTARNSAQKRSTTGLDRLLRRLILPWVLPAGARAMRRVMSYRVDVDPRLADRFAAAA